MINGLASLAGPPPRLADEGAETVLRRLDLIVTRRLDGILQGDYAGLLPGPGSDPGEARAYTPGDDVRRMDWNLTARTNTPHVRLTIADRELECWVVVDLSASVDFGTALCEKRDLALAATAAIGYLTARVGNRLGALVIHPGGIHPIPARPGREHLQALLHKVATTPRADGGGTTDLGPALVQVDRLARRRGLVVVISDWLGPNVWTRPLRVLRARHEVLAVELVDPRESDLPDVGALRLVDPETGEHLEVDTRDARLRRCFAEAATDRREALAKELRQAGADHLVLSTDGDWLKDIVRFVGSRKARLRP